MELREQRLDEITFNGLDRPAMFAGAPVKPLGMAFLILAFLALVGSFFYGLITFLLMLLIVPIWLILKVLCEHDENALNVLKYNVLCYIAYRFNFHRRSKLRTLTIQKNKLFSMPTYLPYQYGDEE